MTTDPEETMISDYRAISLGYFALETPAMAVK